MNAHLGDAMQLKVDENLPVEIIKLLEDNGHNAVTVLEQNLGGEPDSHIAEICQKEKRALVTLRESGTFLNLLNNIHEGV